MPNSEWRGNPQLALLAGSEEDRLTQYLGQLLQAKQVLRAFLADVCKLTALPDLSSVVVRNQAVTAGGRPDLTIQDDHTLLIVEAKVMAPLGSTQLVPYAQALQQWKARRPESSAHLFLLAPATNTVDLLDVGQKQLEQADLSDTPLHFITWEEIAALCSRLGDSVHDVRLRTYLTDFHDLIVYRLGEPDRPFTEEEINLLTDHLIGNAIVRTQALVDRTKDILLQSENMEIKTTPSRGIGFDGYHVQYANRGWWFGLWIDVWGSVGGTPIFLKLRNLMHRPVQTNVLTGLPDAVEYRARTSTGVVMPLPVRAGIELNQLAQEHAQIIREVIRQFPESGQEA